MEFNGAGLKKITSANKGDIISIKIEGRIKNNSLVVKTTDIAQLNKLKEKINTINKKINITGNITMLKNREMILEITDGKNVSKVKYGLVLEAINAPLSNENVLRQISKLGNTPFILKDLKINKDENIFVSNRDLNEIRRQAVELLIKMRLYTTNYKKSIYKKVVPDFQITKKVNVLLENSNLYKYIKNLNVNYIYTEDIKLMKYNDPRLILKIPRVVNQESKSNYPLLISEIGSINNTNVIATDFSLNVTNSYTIAFLHAMGVNIVGLSYELNFEQINRMIDSYKNRYQNNPNLELIVYGREELMIGKFSLNQKYNSNKLSLVDRYNKVYPIRQKNDLMYIYNSQNLDIKDIKKYYKIGINYIRYNLFDKSSLMSLKRDDLTFKNIDKIIK